jgi:CO/xanthine dehydrogenase FAD-binding subunit
VKNGQSSRRASVSPRQLACDPARECRAGARRSTTVVEDDRVGLADRRKDIKEINADIHASESYRRAMIPVFTRRALEGAAARA